MCWIGGNPPNEPRAVFFNPVPQVRLCPTLPVTSLTQLSLGELRQRLLSHGETAPRSWEKSHIVLRLTEIEGTLLSGPVKEKSPLRLLGIRINQASCKKCDLQQLAQEITRNETIAVLNVRSMDQAAQLTPGHRLDLVGSGKSCCEVLASDP